KARRSSERIKRYTRAWEEEMPYRISYLDRSMLADERLTAGTSQTEEFSTEPAALARARELIEDSHYHAISFTGNSERLAGVLQAGLKQRFGESRVDLMAYGRTPWSSHHGGSVGPGLGGRLRSSEGEFLKVGRQGDANRLKELTSDAGGRGAQQEALAHL